MSEMLAVLSIKIPTTGCHATRFHITSFADTLSLVYLSAYLSVLSVCSQQLSPGDIMAICGAPKKVRNIMSVVYSNVPCMSVNCPLQMNPSIPANRVWVMVIKITVHNANRMWVMVIKITVHNANRMWAMVIKITVHNANRMWVMVIKITVHNANRMWAMVIKITVHNANRMWAMVIKIMVHNAR